MGWMHNCDRMDQWLDDVEKQIGVCGHLDHDCVLRGQVLPGPFSQLRNGSLVRSKYRIKLWIDADGDEVVFVNIETDVTFGSRINVRHILITSIRICWQTWPVRPDAFVFGRDITHGFELGLWRQPKPFSGERIRTGSQTCERTCL